MSISLHPWPKGRTMDGASFAMVEHHRLLASDWFRMARRPENAEAAVIGMGLWFAALRCDPAGVLPDDDAALCDIAGLGVDLDRWLRLKPVALYGWEPCIVAVEAREDGHLSYDPDDPETWFRGWWHPSVHRMAARAISSLTNRRGLSEGATAAAERQRRKRIRDKLLSERLTRDEPPEQAVAFIAEWVSANRLSISGPNLRAAWHEWREKSGATMRVIPMK